MKRLAILVAAYLWAASAHAIITVPAGSNPGDEYRLAFITLGTTTALSSDINFYNDFVTAQANMSAELVALGTTWRVIGSTSSISAKVNTDTDDAPAGLNGVPIFRLDGATIADNYDDLWDDTIQNPLFVAQDGTILDTCCGTWTGTTQNGETFIGFALGDGPTVIDGAPSGTGTNWVQTGPFGAGNLQFLYGISGVLTVPVPEPTTLALLAAGLLGLTWRRVTP